MKRFVWIPVAVLLICGVVYLATGWFDWRRLTLPIDLRSGVLTRSPEFRVRLDTRYVVAIEVERNVLNDDLLCLLGGVPFRPPCSVESVVDMDWTLWGGSQKIASGSSRNERGWGFGSTIKRTIGQFEGSSGTPYVLEVVSRLNASALAAANPRIVVDVNPGVTKDYYVSALLVAVVLAPAAGLGVMWLIIWAVLGAFVWPKSK
jgi:hypothetical protein